jgi:aerobic-type carbon monoxide dehydrogenase small subunit (CoxS/CutS family)
MKISFHLNGEPASAEVPGGTLLLDLVRGRGLTGTKEGCGVGVCGACTVLVDDRPVSSCLYLAACVEGSRVETVEGLARSDPGLTESFVDHEGMQCGICTPGQVVAAAALKRDNPGADRDEVIRFMSGNLCRCTGYQSILAAVEAYLAS